MQDSLSTVSEPTSTISLREYGDVLRRRRAIILQTFVIVLVAGVLVTLFQPPVYHGSGRLLLEAPSYVINSVNSSDPLSDLLRLGNPYSMPTQVELLQTSDIRKQVADKIGTVNLPTMTISALEGTQIIEIVSEGDNPETVASAPNTLMDVFVDQSAGNSGKELKNALDFASKNADQAQKDLDRSELQLRIFKQQHNIQELQSNEAAQIRLVQELSGDFDAASQQLQVLEARIGATRQEMASTQQSKNSMLSLLEDPAIQTIENEISAASIQLGTIYKTPGGFEDGNTTVERLKKQLSLLNDREKVLRKQFAARNTHFNPAYLALNDSLLQSRIQESELLVKESILRGQLVDAKKRLASFPAWEAEYEKLQREDASAKQNLALFSSKKFDLALRNETKRIGATIMEKATIPTTPIRPKKAQNIVLAGLLGLFLGLCLALLQELFDDRINNPEEAERVLRVPTLGHIPMIEEEGLRLIRDISTFSPLMEAYRSLRTNINFAAVGSELHSLVITSSVPAEGKSTTVANLAMAMALDNKQVIVVDADLRRPSIHKLFKKDSSPGLTDLLIGTHTIDEVIQDTNVPGVRVIPAGSPPPNPAELLGSAAMGHVLEALEQSCDIVLFDSPPTLAVADAVVLASRTDGVLLLVGYGETKKTSTKKAIEILSRANANLLGVVLNRIEGPNNGYYYGKYYIPATDRNSRPAPGATPAANASVAAMSNAKAAGETVTPIAPPENTKEEEDR
jgi:succinoglycan biosynthesis transport protein ExoP